MSNIILKPAHPVAQNAVFKRAGDRVIMPDGLFEIVERTKAGDLKLRRVGGGQG